MCVSQCGILYPVQLSQILIASGQTATVGYGFVTQTHEVAEVRNYVLNDCMLLELLVIYLAIIIMFAVDCQTPLTSDF